ncbi:MAG: hypothetical protein AAGG75_00190 [Bacteroidota bacterium]
MHYLKYLGVMACLLFFTGCFEVLEQIQLDKKGKGTYTVGMDLSSMLEDPMMKQLLLEGVKKDGPQLLDKAGKLEMDSVMYFKNDEGFVKPEGHDKVWETAKVEMLMSESKSKMTMNLTFDFDNVGDIKHFYSELQNKGGQAAGLANMGMLPIGNFSFKKKLLTRLPTPKGEPLFDPEDQNIQMMRMMFTGATYTTQYNFPGKVKSVSMPGAVVDKKTVKVTVPILDMLDQKAELAGEIKFKNR